MAMLNESNLLAMKERAAKFRTHHVGTKLNEAKRQRSPSEPRSKSGRRAAGWSCSKTGRSEAARPKHRCRSRVAALYVKNDEREMEEKAA